MGWWVLFFIVAAYFFHAGEKHGKKAGEAKVVGGDIRHVWSTSYSMGYRAGYEDAKRGDPPKVPLDSEDVT